MASHSAFNAAQLLTRLRALGVQLTADGDKLRFQAPPGTMTPALVDELRANKAGLLAELSREGPLAREADTTRFRASFAQERLWFLDQLEGAGSSTYNVPEVLRLEGAVSATALERALEALGGRHEVLRTTFVAVDGVPYQVVHPTGVLGLRRVDARSDEDARAIVVREAHAPFDLATGPVARALLVRVRDDVHLFSLCIHHIATDGWSNGILMSELWTLYAAFAEGKPSPLAPLTIDYADFATWQRSWLSGDVLERQLAFWKEQLTGAPAVLELPTDHPRPAVKQNAGGSIRFGLADAAVERVRALCLAEGVTPFMVLLAAYQCVLSRWSGQRDIVVGTPIANRTREELEGIVGFFVNTLAMRARFEANTSFVEVLRQVKAAALSAYAHQDVPFEKLVEELRVARDMSRTPIFQTMFVLQNANDAQPTVPGITVQREDEGLDIAKFDLMLAIEDDGKALQGVLNYDKALFDGATIARLAEHYVTLLDAAMQVPDEKVDHLALMNEGERARVLDVWNATRRADADADVCVHELFQEQAQRTPDAIAVEDERQRLTYAALAERAERIAGWLKGRGAHPEARVAISVARSADMIAAVLGVLEAGCAYVPIDPSHPEDRRAFMRKDSACVVVLDDETLQEAIASPRGAATRERVPPSRLAYVLFTSGSTGRPKGVMVEHRSVVNLVRSLLRFPGVMPNEVALALTTLSFDVSGAEIFVPLAAGAKLVVGTEEHARDPALLAGILERFGVTFAGATPATWRMMTNEGWRPPPTMRIHVAGEALPRDLADRLIERGARLFNLYGPTETTIYSSGTEVRLGERITIGRPIDNTQTYVLDAQMAPVPVGVFGELFIGGTGVTRGYVARPELTAEKFVPDPFSKQPGARLYRTGDMVRWLADGSLEYVGRRDHQVKVRGFRIELGEIEAGLRKANGVRESVVVAREDAPGDKRIVAYVVGEVSADDLREHLRATLPDYMIPSAFVLLSELPLTATGKIDRKALPRPDFGAHANEYLAPRTPTEAAIALIFSEVLAITGVGIHDDFFALGGHSLLAMRVVSRIRVVLAVDLRVRALFENPTVARLAKHVSAAGADRDAAARALTRVDRAKPIPASFAQAGLWLLDQLAAGSSGAVYNMPEIVRLSGAIDAGVLERAVRQIVDRHEALRTTFTAVEGEPHQVIHRSGSVQLARLEAESEEEALTKILLEVDAPFDLTKGPLFRTALVRIRDDVHLFALCTHHVVSDGWSNAILMSELTTVYSALAEGKAPSLDDQPFDYPDYAAWQRAHLTGDVLASEIAFWKEQLAGAPPSLELPTDRTRPALWSGRGDGVPLYIEPALGRRVESFARAHATTTFAVLLAGWSALLSRYASQSDVVLGFTAAGRTRPETEGIVGLFANMLPLRTTVDAQMSFGALVDLVRDRLLVALEHQDLPFDVLVSELNVPRDLARHPVFQVGLGFQKHDGALRALGEARVEPVGLPSTGAKWDLSWNAQQSAEGAIDGDLTYATDLFERSTIERVVTWYVRLLDAGTRMAEQPLAELPLLDEAERRAALFLAVPAPPALEPWTVHIERHAVATPNVVAVVDGNRELTYAELEEKSDRMAAGLVARGIRRGDVVAVTGERRLEWVVSVVAVHKALGTYMPLDPQLPEKRRGGMLARANVRLVVTQLGRDTLAGPIEPPVVTVAELLDTPLPAKRGGLVPHPRDAAYIIFTSGSTGEPKGVVVEHHAFSVLVDNWVVTMGVKFGERALQVVSTSFDVCMGEIGAPLRVGATVVLRNDQMMMGSMAEFLRAIEELRIDVFHPPAVFWHALCAEIGTLKWPKAVHTIVPGGDQLSLEASMQWFAALGETVRVINGYGPTEVTVACITNPLSPRDVAIDIGVPFSETAAYVLDPELRPVLPGAIGELWLGGSQLARGYVNDPAQTAWRYVPDPFASEPGARMYRTGDLVRVASSGKIRFIGRADGQVKIRGFRIELGEVTATIRSLAGVVDAVVIVREDIPGDKRLVAYFVGAVDEEAIRAAAKDALPKYMMPSAFVRLPALPKSATDKVDRRALPAPAYRHEIIAPRTKTEQALADAWREVLKLEAVSVNDNFFDLGGHSLLAMRLVGRIKSQHAFDVSLTSLFRAPTIAELAQMIDSGAGAARTSPVVSLRTGTSPTIVLVHAVGGTILPYRPLVDALGADRSVVALESLPVAADAPVETLAAMAMRYATELLASGASGPFVLVGWSMGGALAFEMARDLLAREMAVEHVVMIDTVAALPEGRSAAIEERNYFEPFIADLIASAGLSLDATPKDLGELANALRRAGHSDVAEAELEARFRIFVRNAWAHENYSPRPIAAPVTLLRAKETLAGMEESLGWRGQSDALEMRTVPGDHYTIVREPDVLTVAAVVNEAAFTRTKRR